MADRRNTKVNTRRIGDVPYNYGTEAPKLEPRQIPEKRTPASRKTTRPKERVGAGFVIFFAVTAILLIASCFLLIYTNSEVMTSQKKVVSMQSELQKTRADNDAMEIFLNKSIDLSAIYKRATSELGMVYPSNEQIIFYKRSNEGFVRQNEDIPNE